MGEGITSKTDVLSGAPEEPGVGRYMSSPGARHTKRRQKNEEQDSV